MSLIHNEPHLHYHQFPCAATDDTCLPFKVIEAIAFALAETSGLHVLKLQCNGINLIAVRKLCDALLVNSTLKELYLSEDIITFDSDILLIT